MARNEYISGLVGASIGRVEEVDLEYGEIKWGEFMRVRITLDITKPLIRRKKMNNMRPTRSHLGPFYL